MVLNFENSVHARCGDDLHIAIAQNASVRGEKSTEAIMKELVPAAELACRASRPYPGDSEEYRKARTRLLAEEIELRRHIERVAAQRRSLPLGGEARCYKFLDENGKTVRLGDMFGPHETL